MYLIKCYYLCHLQSAKKVGVELNKSLLKVLKEEERQGTKPVGFLRWFVNVLHIPLDIVLNVFKKTTVNLKFLAPPWNLSWNEARWSQRCFLSSWYVGHSCYKFEICYVRSRVWRFPLAHFCAVGNVHHLSDGLMFCCSLGSITIAIKLMIPS